MKLKVLTKISVIMILLLIMVDTITSIANQHHIDGAQKLESYHNEQLTIASRKEEY